MHKLRNIFVLLKKYFLYVVEKAIQWAIWNDRHKILGFLLYLKGELTGKIYCFRYLIPYFDSPSHRSFSSNYSTYSLGHKVFEKDQEKVQVTFNSIGITCISDATLIFNNNVVLDRKFAYFQQTWPDARNEVVDLSCGQFIRHEKDMGLFEFSRKTVLINEGILISGHWHLNWYHWLIEILSKAGLIKELEPPYKNYPLLVPEDVLDKPHGDLLRILFPEKHVVPFNSTERYIVKKMLYADAVNYAPPQYRGIDVQGEIQDNMIHFEMFHSYRGILFQAIRQAWGDVKSDKYPERIIISRKQDSRPYNQNEVIDSLSEFGFVPVYFEDLPLVEQIRHIYNAKFIVGATGAGWANLIFCRQGAKGIIWTPDCTRHTTPYSNLAFACGVDLFYLYIPTDTKSWQEFKNLKNPYRIDVDELTALYCSIS